jgi:hypothetical protein
VVNAGFGAEAAIRAKARSPRGLADQMVLERTIDGRSLTGSDVLGAESKLASHKHIYAGHRDQQKEHPISPPRVPAILIASA